MSIAASACRRLAACALALSLAACEDDPPPRGKPFPHTIQLQTERGYLARVGEPVTIEARFLDEKGALLGGCVRRWNAVETGLAGSHHVEERTPQPGVEQLVVTMQYPGDLHVSLEVVNEDPFDQKRARFELLVIGYGGTPSAILPLHRELHLLAGETRLAGASLVEAARGKSSYGTGRISCTTEHPAVATVDDRCRVTGTGPGTTTLRFSSGGAAASLPVKVAAGTSAVPAVGQSVRMDGMPVDHVGSNPPENTWISGTHVVEDTLANDSLGNPFWATTTAAGAGWDSYGVALASWTGSGFSFEQVHRPWERPRQPHLAVDEKDRAWLVYADERTLELVVADKALRDAAATWRHRTIDGRHPEAAARKLRANQSKKADGSLRPAVLARKGGGAWVAWLEVTHNWGYLFEPDCHWALKLAEVRDDAIGVQTVAEAFTGIVNNQDECFEDYGLWSEAFVHLLPPAAEGGLPSVVSAYGFQAAGLVRFDAAGGSWAGTALAPADFETASGPASLKFATFVRPLRADSQPALAYYRQPDTYWLHVPGTRQDNFAWAGALYGSDHKARLWAFRNADFTWLGGSTARVLQRLSFGGGLYVDDAFGAGPIASERDVMGMWTDGQRLDLVTEDLVFHRRRLPAPAATTSGDVRTTGQRLAGERRTPRVRERPLVRADGARFVSLRPIFYAEDDFDPDPDTVEIVNAGLLRSAGPNAPFAAVPHSAQQLADWAKHAQLWAIPGALFGRDWTTTGPTLKFGRSLDEGLTWLAWGSITTLGGSQTRVLSEYVHPSGAVFVAVTDGGNLQLFHAPAVHENPVFTSLGGLPAALDAEHDFIAEQGWSGFVAHADRVSFVSSVVHVGGARKLAIQTWALDGTATGHALAAVGHPGNRTHRVDRMISTADGHLLLHAFGLSVGGADEVIRIDPADGTFTRHPIHGRNAADLAWDRLSDGRVVAAYSASLPDGRTRAVWTTSADGIAWSEEKPFRLEGGGGQLVGAIAAEPDGGLLAVIGDNNAITNSLDGDRIDSNPGTPTLLDAPPVDYLIRRVDAP